MQIPPFVPLNRRLRSFTSWLPLMALGLALGTGCGSTDDPVAPGPLTTTGGVATPGSTMPWPGDKPTIQPGGTAGSGVGPGTGPGGNPTGIPDTTSTGLPQPDPNNCIGVNPNPPAGAGYAYQTGTSTGTDTGTGTGTGTGPEIPEGCTTPPNCVGMQSPAWELHDYQPNSCGFNQDYGINTFNKHVTMVVLLTGW